MDSRFLVASYDPEYQTDKVAAQFFSASNITAFENTNTTYVSYPGSVVVDTGLANGHYIELWWNLVVGIQQFQVRHIWPGPWGLWTEYENLMVIEPYRSQLDDPSIPYFLVRSDLTTFWENVAVNTSYCEWHRNGYSAQTFIYPFNDTWTIDQSWVNGYLNVTMGYEINLNASNINAFNLLSQMMTFQSPNIGLTGTANTILNASIAIPLWIMIAILIVKLLQSIIPFIRGIEE